MFTTTPLSATRINARTGTLNQAYTRVAMSRIGLATLVLGLAACSGDSGTKTTTTTAAESSVSIKAEVLPTPAQPVIGRLSSNGRLTNLTIKPLSMLTDLAVVQQTTPITITVNQSVIDPNEVYLVKENGLTYVVNRTPRAFKELLLKTTDVRGIDSLTVLSFGSVVLAPFTKVQISNYATGFLPSVVNTRAFYTHTINTKVATYDPRCDASYSPQGACVVPLSSAQLKVMLLRNAVFAQLMNSADGYGMLQAYTTSLTQTYYTAANNKDYSSQYALGNSRCFAACSPVIGLTGADFYNDIMIRFGNGRDLNIGFSLLASSIYNLRSFAGLTPVNYFGSLNTKMGSPTLAQVSTDLVQTSTSFNQSAFEQYLYANFANYSWGTAEGMNDGFAKYVVDMLNQKVLDPSVTPVESVPKYVFLPAKRVNTREANSTPITVYVKGASTTQTVSFQYLSKEKEIFDINNASVTTAADSPVITLRFMRPPAERAYIRLQGNGSNEVMSQAVYPAQVYSSMNSYFDPKTTAVVSGEHWLRISNINNRLYKYSSVGNGLSLAEYNSNMAGNVCKGVTGEISRGGLARTTELHGLMKAMKDKYVVLPTTKVLAIGSFDVNVMFELNTNFEQPFMTPELGQLIGIACAGVEGEVHQMSDKTLFRGKI
jgi:hypothetical protein